MEDETKVIRDQMTETRTSLSEKIDALEDKVLGTVQDTTASVTETMQSVKEAVEDTVSSVTEGVQDTVTSVRETLDLGRQFRNHPWLMFGGSVAVGFVAGRLTGGLPSPGAPAPAGGNAFSGTPGGVPSYSEPARAYTPAPRQEGPSWTDSALESFQPALKKLQGLAVGAITGLIAQTLLDAAPEKLRGQIQEVADSVTTSLGGKPVHGLKLGESGDPRHA